MEIKSKTTNRMLDFRRNLLESASFDYAVAAKIAGETGSLLAYRSVESLLDAFEYTLEPGSQIHKDIHMEKDQIELEKKQRFQQYEQMRERIGYFERYDIEKQMPVDIETESVGKRLQSCWSLSRKHGLFNE